MAGSSEQNEPLHSVQSCTFPSFHSLGPYLKLHSFNMQLLHNQCHNQLLFLSFTVSSIAFLPSTLSSTFSLRNNCTKLTFPFLIQILIFKTIHHSFVKSPLSLHNTILDIEQLINQFPSAVQKKRQPFLPL